MNFKEAIGSDFKDILNGEFSEDLTISDGVTTVTVKGLFDSTYQQIDPDTNAIVISSKPRATLFLNDVAFKLKQGLVVVIKGKTYKIREVQPDGEGSAVLYLE